MEINEETLRRSEYRPMDAWGYFGYSILYSLPILGFIFLIIHSFMGNYIARRNFARSHFCILVIVLVPLTIVSIVLLVSGNLSSILSEIAKRMPH